MGGEWKSRIFGSSADPDFQWPPPIPGDAVTQWESLGRLPVGARGLEAGMPGCPLLAGEANDMDIKLVGSGCEAEVLLQVVRCGEDFVRVAAVKVLFAEGRPDNEVFAGNAIIDTGSMMIADMAGLAEVWKVGGPSNQTNLIFAKNSGPAADRLRALLDRHGFEYTCTTEISDDFVRFPGPLTDVEIALLRRIISECGIPVRLNAWKHQTEVEIDLMLQRQLAATLTFRGRPCAFVFPTGWGDGLYPWKRLLRKGTVIGYSCSFDVLESDGD